VTIQIGLQGSTGLVVSVGTRVCSLPLGNVIETMRALPIEPVAGVPSFVMGLAIIRGAPVPVVSLAAAIGAAEIGGATWFVTLRLGDRRVALAVDAVVGVRDLDSASLEQMPPLLQGASTDSIDAIGTLDAHLLVVMRASRMLSAEVWRTIEAHR
jgi:purine-binding chemotaxis protein CheW